MILTYEQAKENLLTGYNLDCQQFFAQRGYKTENAYCHLLKDELNEAKIIADEFKEDDIRAHWLLIMISLIEGNIREYPSYFQLRNFLEIDLNLLITYYKGDYIEKIIRYSDFLFTINPEVYKYIGRVLYNNCLKEQAMYFLIQAKSYFYNDPELHFLLAFIYYNDKDYEKARKSAKDCLEILPDYFPAVDLSKKLTGYLS